MHKTLWQARRAGAVERAQGDAVPPRLRDQDRAVISG